MGGGAGRITWFTFQISQIYFNEWALLLLPKSNSGGKEKDKETSAVIPWVLFEILMRYSKPTNQPELRGGTPREQTAAPLAALQKDAR